MAIHPAQIPVIAEASTPDPARVDWARRVIAAMEGTGVAQIGAG
jgi:citrate lyase beta subunit